MSPDDVGAMASLVFGGVAMATALIMLAVLIRHLGVLSGALAYCGLLGFAGCAAAGFGAHSAAFALIFIGLASSGVPLALTAANAGVGGSPSQPLLAFGLVATLGVFGLVAWAHVPPIAIPTPAPTSASAPAPSPVGFAAFGLLAMLVCLAPIRANNAAAPGPNPSAARVLPAILAILAAGLLWAPDPNGLAAGGAIALAFMLHEVLTGAAIARRMAPDWMMRVLLLIGLFMLVGTSAAAGMRGDDPFAREAFVTLANGVNMGAFMHQAGWAIATAGGLTIAHRSILSLLSLEEPAQ